MSNRMFTVKVWDGKHTTAYPHKTALDAARMEATMNVVSVKLAPLTMEQMTAAILKSGSLD